MMLSWIFSRFRSRPSFPDIESARYTSEPDESLSEFHERMWVLLDPAIRAEAIAVLARELPTPTKDWVRSRFAEDGGNWPSSDETSPEVRQEIEAEFGFCIPSPFHFGAGMGIRNLLRQEVGADSILPSGNWDDFYIAAVERAVGVR